MLKFVANSKSVYLNILYTMQYTSFILSLVLMWSIVKRTVRLCHVYFVIVRLCFVYYITVIANSCFSSLFAESVSRLAERYVKLVLSLYSVWCSFEFQFIYRLYYFQIMIRSFSSNTIVHRK